MCTLCCQFLWIVHFRLPVPYSLTFIYNTPFWGAGSRSLLCRSCPGLAHFVFLSVDTTVILTFVLGLNCCRSRLITRKSLLTPAFVTPGFILTSQIYPDFGVRLKTFCNNITNLTRLRRSSHHALYIPKRQSKMTIQRNWQHGVHKTKNNKTKTQHNMY